MDGNAIQSVLSSVRSATQGGNEQKDFQWKPEHAELIERNGFLRRVAGDEEFDKAMTAFEAMRSGRKRGFLVSGNTGVGKSRFCEAVRNCFHGYRIDCSEIPEWMTNTEWIHDLFRGNQLVVYLDDVGADTPYLRYGTMMNPVKDLILAWDLAWERGCRTRLVISTNLDSRQMRERYDDRVMSRLNNLYCFRMNGGDKRKENQTHA